MKQLLLLLLIICMLGCKKNQKSTVVQKANNTTADKNTPPQTQEEDAVKLLKEVLKTNGRDKLLHSVIKYQGGKVNLNYIIKRNGHKYNYTMSRTNNDINYMATAKNGVFEYTENGKPKSYGMQNSFLEKQLLFNQDFMVMPAKLIGDNTIALRILDTEKIVEDKKYIEIQALYKEFMTTDLVKEYRLYINPKTKLIDYVSYFYIVKGRVQLRKSINHRDINGIKFNDYEIYNFKDIDIEPNEVIDLFNKRKAKKSDTLTQKIESVELLN